MNLNKTTNVTQYMLLHNMTYWLVIGLNIFNSSILKKIQVCNKITGFDFDMLEITQDGAKNKQTYRREKLKEKNNNIKVT